MVLNYLMWNTPIHPPTLLMILSGYGPQLFNEKHNKLTHTHSHHPHTKHPHTHAHTYADIHRKSYQSTYIPTDSCSAFSWESCWCRVLCSTRDAIKLASWDLSSCFSFSCRYLHMCGTQHIHKYIYVYVCTHRKHTSHALYRVQAETRAFRILVIQHAYK